MNDDLKNIQLAAAFHNTAIAYAEIDENVMRICAALALLAQMNALNLAAVALCDLAARERVGLSKVDLIQPSPN